MTNVLRRGPGFACFRPLVTVGWMALLTGVVGTIGVSATGCSSDDGGNPDVDPIAWVSPTIDASVAVDETVELTVKVNDASVTLVRFVVDDKPLASCDTTAGPNECHRDAFFRYTTTFHTTGSHHLVASFPGANGDESASLTIVVRAAAPADAGPPPPVLDRGFLDPDKPSHNVYGGVSWSVKGQYVTVENPPAGSTTAVAACMKLYGTSIVKNADAAKVSRASVVATAITESNCSNPAGSSDGLSSGPMQVTGSTCASVVTGYTSASCKTKMYTDPDFSFLVGAKYMGSSYQVAQHGHDPPKIGAAYNAGSVRSSTANRWHMIVTGNHLERWVGAYNAYRDWEAMNGVAKLALAARVANRPVPLFEGEHVATAAALPPTARPGQVVFVGDWQRRDGAFVTFREGVWQAD